MPQTLTLHITLVKPTPGVDFGLQEGSGTRFTILQKQRATGGDLHFEAIIQTRKTAEGAIDFSGKLVQGPKGERFLYIGIGTFVGQTGTAYSRRLKIPLKSIDDHLLQQAGEAFTLYTRVQGTDKKGEPTCGTVKPFDGWKTKPA